MMVSEPPSSMLRAAPKKRLGLCRASASTPPDMVRPSRPDGVVSARQAGDGIEQDDNVLARARPCAWRFSMTISATCTWRLGGLVECGADDLAACTVRSMSVTSSGRSSMSRMIEVHLGVILRMALAIFCSSMVLPVRGGATMRPRWPLPMGVTRSITRRSSSPRVSSFRRLLGNSGVRLSKWVLFRLVAAPLMASTFSSAKKRSCLWADGSGRDQIAGLQIEAADLRGRDVDIFGAGKVIELGSAGTRSLRANFRVRLRRR